MTPKEKAEELVKQLYGYMPFRDMKLTSCEEHPYLIYEMEMLSAKQCALIAVDEIIGNIVNTNIDYGASWTYWQEVKQEIEKL